MTPTPSHLSRSEVAGTPAHAHYPLRRAALRRHPRGRLNAPLVEVPDVTPTPPAALSLTSARTHARGRATHTQRRARVRDNHSRTPRALPTVPLHRSHSWVLGAIEAGVRPASLPRCCSTSAAPCRLFLQAGWQAGLAGRFAVGRPVGRPAGRQTGWQAGRAALVNAGPICPHNSSCYASLWRLAPKPRAAPRHARHDPILPHQRLISVKLMYHDGGAGAAGPSQASAKPLPSPRATPTTAATSGTDTAGLTAEPPHWPMPRTSRRDHRQALSVSACELETSLVRFRFARRNGFALSQAPRRLKNSLTHTHTHKKKHEQVPPTFRLHDFHFQPGSAGLGWAPLQQRSSLTAGRPWRS